MFRAQWGKRHIIICLPVYEVQIGVIPSDDAVRQAFNDTSAPGDAVADALVPVHRMNMGAACNGLVGKAGVA